MKTPLPLSLTPDCRVLRGKVVPLQSQPFPGSLLALDHPQGKTFFPVSPLFQLMPFAFQSVPWHGRAEPGPMLPTPSPCCRLWRVPHCFPLLLNKPNSNSPWGPRASASTGLPPAHQCPSGPRTPRSDPAPRCGPPTAEQWEAQGEVTLLSCKDSPPTLSSTLPQGIIPAQTPYVCLHIDQPLPDSEGSSLAADQHTHTPRQGWPLTSAPRGGTPGSRQGSTAGVLRSGSKCSWLAALNQMLGVKRGESQSSAPPRVQEPPGEGSPLPPHPTAPSQPHTAYLNLQASRQTLRCCLCPSSAARPAQRAGCWSQWIQAAGGETESDLNPTKAGSGPGSRLSCPHCTPSLTLVIFVSLLVSMGRLPLLMGTVFQPSSATRLPRPPGHKGDRHKA